MFYNLVLDENKASYAQEISKFSDVDAGQLYSAAVGYFVEAGFLSGYPDGTFKGNNPITRAEFVTIASKFIELNLNGDISFSDVDSSHWAYDSIKSAFNNGWILGYPDGMFAPGKDITRAEAAVIINKMLGWTTAAQTGDSSITDLNGDEWYYDDVIMAANGVI